MRARSIFAAAALTLSTLTAGAAQAQDCQPGLVAEFTQTPAAQAAYTQLATNLIPTTGAFTTALQNLSAGTYANLLNQSTTLAGTVPGGRVVVALPDGTVAVDTGAPAGSNTFANFQAKNINENHNSRLAFFNAQEFPCGVGIERKFSTSTNTFETAVALRIGDHLNSFGTVRFSRP